MSSARDTAYARRRTNSRGRHHTDNNVDHHQNENVHHNALAQLNQTQRLFVKQHVEMMEAITGWEGANQYTVLDQAGNPLYHCQEESGACMRQCCKHKFFLEKIVYALHQPQWQ